jgi:hypothetical protein
MAIIIRKGLGFPLIYKGSYKSFISSFNISFVFFDISSSSVNFIIVFDISIKQEDPVIKSVNKAKILLLY